MSVRCGWCSPGWSGTAPPHRPDWDAVYSNGQQCDCPCHDEARAANQGINKQEIKENDEHADQHGNHEEPRDQADA